MNPLSTERVQRYRQRQSEAGRKRIVLFIEWGKPIQAWAVDWHRGTGMFSESTGDGRNCANLPCFKPRVNDQAH